MCCIIYTPKGWVTIPLDHMRNAHKRNDDGWGFMYAQDGKIIMDRDVTKHDDFLARLKAVPEDQELVVHFRFGTSGSKGKEMAHPFPVFEDDEGNCTLAMMHNGVIASTFKPDYKEGLSDTAVMIRDFIQPLLLDDPGRVENENFQKAVGAMLGNPNKLVFLTGAGKIIMVNAEQGDWKDGRWYSNTYSIESDTPRACGQHIGGYQGHNSSRHPYNSDFWDGYDDYSSGYYGTATQNKNNVIGAPPTGAKNDKPSQDSILYLAPPQDQDSDVAGCGWRMPGSDWMWFWHKKHCRWVRYSHLLKCWMTAFVDTSFKNGSTSVRFLHERALKPWLDDQESKKDAELRADGAVPEPKPSETVRNEAAKDDGVIPNEPLDSLDTRPLDDEDFEEGDELPGNFTAEEEVAVAQLVEQLELMSEAELYNWVADNSYELVTDVLAYAMYYR